jgi:polyphosphate kinase
MIDKLYEASNAGVKTMEVRGICLDSVKRNE